MSGSQEAWALKSLDFFKKYGKICSEPFLRQFAFRKEVIALPRRKKGRAASREQVGAQTRRSKKAHDKDLAELASNLSFLGIEGFGEGLVVAGPFLKPQLGRGKQETGDLIFVWQLPNSKFLEVVAVEFTLSSFRSTSYDFERLNKTFYLLRRIWQEWLKELNVRLEPGHSLYFRPFSVSKATGQWSVVGGKRRRIFYFAPLS